jgi:hypothetical protein
MVTRKLAVARWVVITAAVGLAIAIGMAVYSARNASRWKSESEKWLLEVAAREPIWRRDSVTLARTSQVLIDTRGQLTNALESGNRLAAEAARLREERRHIVVTPSVPGLPPSVADTLRACREELSLCEREAQLEKRRADSLTTVAQEARFQIGSLREDLMVTQQSAAIDRHLLSLGRGIVAAADPPCYLVRLGPIRAHCPDRRDVALWTAAGVLTLTAEFSDSPRQRNAQRGVAATLLAFSFVW